MPLVRNFLDIVIFHAFYKDWQVACLAILELVGIYGYFIGLQVPIYFNRDRILGDFL